MSTAVQVQYRRGTASQVSSFTGAAGEIVVDTTNNRVVVQDGATAGGFAAAKLSEVQTNTRTQVSDGNYTAQSTDRLIAYITLTASRIVSLPTASSYPTGSRLLVVDESGACSASKSITLSANGSDLVDGAATAVITAAYGYLAVESNGANKWTIIDQTSTISGSVTITSGTIDATTIGGTTPAAGTFTTIATVRHAVADANYTVAAGISTVAYTAITAARTVTLPAANSFAAGQQLLVVDESGSCSATKTIAVSRAGSDTINGAASATLASAYAYFALESNGSNAWTIVDQSTLSMAQQNASSVAITGGTIDGVTIGGTTPEPASVTAPNAGDSSARVISSAWYGQNMPDGFLNKFRNATMDVWQRGTSSLTVTTSGSYTADGWIVLPTGASVTAAQAGGRLLTKNSLQVTGATSVTDLIIKQRIESYIAAAFCSQTVTVQAQVYNNTGGSITPTLTVKHAASQDVWTSPTTDVSAASLQACANGAWSQVAYTFAANANSYNGLEISFDFGNNFSANTKSVQITECDIRVTPGATAGATNSNPPPVELRPVAAELAFCQRYFETSYDIGTAPGTVSADGELVLYSPGLSSGAWVALFGFRFAVAKRAVPTMTYYSPATGASGKLRDATGGADVAASNGSTGLTGGYVEGTMGTSGTINAQVHFVASAEL
jgi:Major tropism determinant N-terminal domain